MRHEGKQQDEAKKKKNKKKNKQLAFGGRLIARSALAQTDPTSDWNAASSIDSARVGVDYRNRELRVRVSADFAGKPRLKNAFAELRLHDGATKSSIRAGRFKMPISAIELESRWALPTADRGLLHTILVDRYQIAGRSVGAMVSAATKAWLRPRAAIGVFQGHDDAGNALEVTASDRFGQDVVARVEIALAHGVAVGASAQARVGSLNVDAPPIIRRGRAGEIDVTLERGVGPGTLRAWLESMVGTSWIAGRAMPCHGYRPCKALFVEGRSIAAYRLGGREPKQRYVELFAIGGALDPDRDTSDDLVVELGGGITYGVWDRWRVQAGMDVSRFGDNAPLGIAQYAAPSANTVRVLVQLGARL